MCISLSVYLFVSLRAKNGEIRIAFLVLPMSVWLLYALSSFSAIFLSCVSLLFFSLRYVLALSFVVDAVFFADLPILLPSVGFSLLLCIIIHLGVFRGSEAKKWVFMLCLCGVYTEKGRTRHLCAPSALCLWLVISCAGMMLCCYVG